MLFGFFAFAIFLLGVGILNLDGALGLLDKGSFCARTMSGFVTFLDPFGRLGLLGDGGICPLIGQKTTLFPGGRVTDFE